MEVEVIFAGGVGAGFVLVFLRHSGEHDEAVDAELAAFSDFLYDLLDAEPEGSWQTLDGEPCVWLRHQEDGLHEMGGR